MVENIEYSKEQKFAIEHCKGHLRIIACAGSGKTQVISERIANLIKNGVPSKKIVAFTFTIKAADELKARVRGILDKDCPDKADFGDMFIGTIDSFCFQFLKQLEPKYKNYDILQGAQRIAYLSKPDNFKRVNLWALRNHSKGGKPLQHYNAIGRFLLTSDIVMMERINPDKLDDSFKKGYAEYIKMLEEDRYFDFTSVIRILLDSIKNDKDIKKNLNETVKHLIVDEYQDVNKIQEELIETLSEGADSVCVVGDDDQCIYSWRGSYVNNIIDFKKKYGVKYDVKDISLDINYRSTNGIIHTASEFIKMNKNRLGIKKMTEYSKLERKYEPGDIICHMCETENEELEYIHNKIAELVNTDFVDKKNKPFSLSYGDFAVLTRSNNYASSVIKYLSEKGIKCLAYSGETVFTRNEVLFAMDCISFVFNCSRYGEYSSKPPEISELRSKYLEIFDKNFPSANVDYFEKEITKIKSEVSIILLKSPKDYLGDLGLQGVYHRIIGSMGAQFFDFGEVYNYHFAVLSTAISDYESVWKRLRASEINGFFQFAKSYGEDTYIETQNSDASLIDAVKVLTIHKAKGLEFPVVFVPDMVKKRKSNGTQVFISDSVYPKELYDGTEEDERRVFYTAFTRSEKYLFITGAKKHDSVVKEREVHPFICELDKKFISDDIKLERKKSGHPIRLIKDGIFPTSFSEITTYDRCGQDYLLRFVYGYNAGVPVTFGYGTNIHNILNIIHNDYIKKKKIPNDNEIDSLIDHVFFLRYATDKITENMKKSAKRIVKSYVKVQSKDFNKILETEKRFEFVLDQAIISGQIDLIKKVDAAGNLKEVEIIDFKTEDSQKDNSLYTMDYEKQLRLYALACMKSLGLKPKKAVIHHLDKNLLFTESSVDISENKLESTKEEIKKDVSDILNKNFPAKPSKLCTECDNRYLCHKKGKIV